MGPRHLCSFNHSAQLDAPTSTPVDRSTRSCSNLRSWAARPRDTATPTLPDLKLDLLWRHILTRPFITRAIYCTIHLRLSSPYPGCFSLLCHMSSISYMSQSSSSLTFQTLFNEALQDYKDKTGTSLIHHPFAKQLETCESVNSITSILQEQAQSFREFREDDGKLTKALNSSVDVLCAPSISSALNEAIGLVVRLKASIEVACL